MTLSYCGIGVATTRAIAIGPVFLLDRSPLTVPPPQHRSGCGPRRAATVRRCARGSAGGPADRVRPNPARNPDQSR